MQVSSCKCRNNRSRKLEDVTNRLKYITELTGTFRNAVEKHSTYLEGPSRPVFKLNFWNTQCMTRLQLPSSSSGVWEYVLRRIVGRRSSEVAVWRKLLNILLRRWNLGERMGVICSTRGRWWLSVACNSKNLKQMLFGKYAYVGE
jgi:hypothetical protein